MDLFDILKVRAGIPVSDPLATLFASRSSEQDVLLYLTADDMVYAGSDGKAYALKEES